MINQNIKREIHHKDCSIKEEQHSPQDPQHSAQELLNPCLNPCRVKSHGQRDTLGKAQKESQKSWEKMMHRHSKWGIVFMVFACVLSLWMAWENPHNPLLFFLIIIFLTVGGGVAGLAGIQFLRTFFASKMNDSSLNSLLNMDIKSNPLRGKK